MRKEVVVSVKLLDNFLNLPEELQKLPNLATEGSSGFDVISAEDLNVVLPPRTRKLVSTGLAFEVPLGFELQVRPKSGNAHKLGVTVLNTPGTVDSDYRGEVKVNLYNAGHETIIIKRGDKIAQLVLAEVPKMVLKITGKLSETARGEGGHGSTSKEGECGTIVK